MTTFEPVGVFADVISTVNWWLAGVWSTFSNRSIALTSKVCDPSVRSWITCGELHDSNRPPSRAHSYRSSSTGVRASVPLNVKVTSLLAVDSRVKESIVVSGAVVSGGAATVQSWIAGDSSTRPNEFVAWTSKWWLPSTSAVTRCGEVQG